MKARFLLPALLAGIVLSGCVELESRSALPDVSADVQNRLRQDLPNLVLSFSLMVIGVGSLGLAGLHRAAQGLELAAFGAFSVLYGVRLAVWTPLAHVLIELTPETWEYVDAVITYFIPVPVLFFLGPYLGQMHLVRWVWRFQLGYAIVATGVDLATEPFTAMGPYRVLVIALFLAALYLMFWRQEKPTKHLKIVRAGLLVFLILAGHATLSGFFPFSDTTSVEPLGLFVFFSCLGYVVLDGFFSSQKELGAINQELETARRIQSSVLPEALPEIEGVELAVRYLPVSAVAGDFYDFLQNERGVSLLVADVSGHGVPAALIASMVKVAYSAQHERAGEPAAVMAEVNRILCGKIRGQFVTGGCLFVDVGGSNVVYASAGHPPLIVVRADGEVLERKLDSVLMGFFAQAEYRQTEVELGQGDKLVLYTDGLIEAMNTRGDFFGVERLRVFFEERAGDSAETLATGILDHVVSWSGRPFDDDVTLLIVGRCSSG